MDTQCSKQVYVGAFFRTHQCRNKARIEHDGKAYCGIHDPVRKRTRLQERIARLDKAAQVEKQNFQNMKVGAWMRKYKSEDYRDIVRLLEEKP